MGERHPVAARAEFFDEGAGLVEFEQPRLAASCVHEHVPLRVGRDSDALPHVETRRQLEEVRNRIERNLRRRRFGLGGPGDVLCEGAPAQQEQSRSDADTETPNHMAYFEPPYQRCMNIKIE